MSFVYSDYQKAVFANIKLRSGNTAVNSVAGSGKTKTMTDGIKNIPQVYSVLASAFGRDIKAELDKRDLPKNTRIQTYNSFGWEICRKASGRRLILEEDKTIQTLQHMVLGASEQDEASWKKYVRFKNPTKRLVSLLKSQLVMTPQEALLQIPALVLHYNIEVPDDKDFDDVVATTYEKCINNKVIYDYDDQKFQVHHQQLEVPVFDFVFVDEVQDTNEMELQLMIKAARMGRFFGFGDPDQAIYGFKGATPGAFKRLVSEFKAMELPLSICYRCPIAAIREAQKIVPRIEAAPWAREGSVGTVETKDFLMRVRPDDFVLCRTIAPLVKRCLELIRSGMPAKVYGRNIGEDLEYLIEKCSKGSGYFLKVAIFKEYLDEYFMRKMQSYSNMKLEALAANLEDKYQTIVALMQDCQTVGDIFRRIKDVFSDNVNRCIKFMSIHKSKGLECEKNVWLLRPDLLPHPRSLGIQWMEEEERRLEYVAITRTMDGFFRVLKEKNEK